MVAKRVHVRGPAPGSIAALRAGDRVAVERSAVERADWAAMARAVMTAWVRGADVEMEGTQDG